jgi:hypothetical protein
MARSGFDVSSVLVQDRQAVHEPALWLHFMHQVLGAAGWQIRRVTWGHAVNRPAWGVHTRDDYGKLVGGLPEIQNAYPGVAFVAPGVDGFDHAFVRRAFKGLPAGCRWDALAVSVDDLPAWYGLDDYGALRLCAGLAAEGARQGRCAPRLILSEMRRADQMMPGLTPEHAAARMIRRLLLLTAAGVVEQTALWWLSGVAHERLTDDPLAQALLRLRSTLMGGRFVKRIQVGNRRKIYLLQCETLSAQPVWVGWVDGAPTQIEVPFRSASAFDAHGRVAPLLPYPRLRLTETPVYFFGQ